MIKLQTMLLPTGEFALIVTDPNNSLRDKKSRKALRRFRKDIGAVAGLAVDEPIEVENAVVDENAMSIRMDGYFGPDEYVGDVQDDEPEQPHLASVTTLFNTRIKTGDFVSEPQTVQFTFEPDSENLQQTLNTIYGADFPAPANKLVDLMGPGPSPVDFDLQVGDNLAALWNAGREFTPAGLVVGQPGDPDLMADTEAFEYGPGEPGDDPEPPAQVITSSEWESPGPDADEPGLYEPQVGDIVRIVRVRGWKAGSQVVNSYHGATGPILRHEEPDRSGEASWVVQANSEAFYGSKIDVFAAEVELVERPKVELIAQAPAAPEVDVERRDVVKVGDQVRILGHRDPFNIGQVGRASYIGLGAVMDAGQPGVMIDGRTVIPTSWAKVDEPEDLLPLAEPVEPPSLKSWVGKRVRIDELLFPDYEPVHVGQIGRVETFDDGDKSVSVSFNDGTGRRRWAKKWSEVRDLTEVAEHIVLGAN